MAWHRRLINLVRREQIAQELDEELSFHLAERMDELMAEGYRESEARDLARQRFGNYTAQKERTREMSIASSLEALGQDLSYGMRQLRLNRGFAMVAVLSLALGIGANTAIFQLLDAVRIRTLPVKNPEQLVNIAFDGDVHMSGSVRARNSAFTYAQFQELKANQRAFSDLFAFGGDRFNLSRGGQARFAQGLYISANFLSGLGVTPILGHDLSPGGDLPGCQSPGVILSYSFWQREFGGSANALNKTVTLDGVTFPVIGVTPKNFFGMEPGYQFDVAAPLCFTEMKELEEKRLTRRDFWWLSMFGRLKPGWTVAKASQSLREFSPQLFHDTLPPNFRPDMAKEYESNRLRAVEAGAGVSELRAHYENPLWILLCVTAVVLLIACANLANLLLAKASARERELAVRQAIGASKWRLVTQLLSESLLLAGLGAAAGALLAQTLSRMLVRFISTATDPVFLQLGIDWRVFGFTALVAVATCLLFGLAPAVRAAKTEPAVALRSGGRSSTAGREKQGLRRALVITQVALSFVLLVGALLFTGSLQNLLNASIGFRKENLLVANVNTSHARFAREKQEQVFKEIVSRFGTQRGVVSAAAASVTPLSGNSWNQAVYRNNDASKTRTNTFMNRVSEAYFQTVAIPLLAGRYFNEHDDLHAPKVAIVNEAFAQKVFKNENPIGHLFQVEGDADETDQVYQVAGLVKNAKYLDVREEFRPTAFFPMAQADKLPPFSRFVLRIEGPPQAVIANLNNQLAQISPVIEVAFQMMETQVSESLLREKLMANLSGGFAVLAGVLSTLGLYGVLSYIVARRRNEIGVRLALGAARSNIIGLVLREAMALVLVGLAAGGLLSFLLSRYAQTLLYGLKPNNPAVLLGAVSVLAVTGFLASFLPAARASRMDPTVALREE